MLLAHLTDAHLLEPRERRSTTHHATMRVTSLGRSLDVDLRATRLFGALEAARKSGAGHLVMTGDLTEMGTDAQFEALAEALDAAGFPEDSVTLLPGNHDAYADAKGWTRAIEGPLARWARSSVRTATGCTIVDRGAFVIAAVDTSVHQSFAKSGGTLRSAALECVARFAAAVRDRPLVVALHHPPTTYQIPVLRWIDSLEGANALRDLMLRAPHVHAVHGHLHRVDDRPLTVGAEARIFCARATMKPGAALRVYEARGSRLAPVASVD